MGDLNSVGKRGMGEEMVAQVSKRWKGLLGAMMGVSYRGERMIGNLPFSLFMGRKPNFKDEEKENSEGERERGKGNKRHEILMSSLPIPHFFPSILLLSYTTTLLEKLLMHICIWLLRHSSQNSWCFRVLYLF